MKTLTLVSLAMSGCELKFFEANILISKMDI